MRRIQEGLIAKGMSVSAFLQLASVTASNRPFLDLVEALTTAADLVRIDTTKPPSRRR